MTYNLEVEKLLREAKEFEKKNNYLKAIKLCKEALKISPDNQQIFLQLGICYNLHGDYDRAVECLLKVTNIGKDGVTLWQSLGDAYRNLKEYRKAIDAYRMALEYDPDEINRDVLISKIDTIVLKVDYSSDEL